MFPWAGEVVARNAPRPVEAFRARERRGPALAVDDTNLPVLAVFVGREEGFDGLIGGMTL